MRATLTSKGQVTIPQEVRQRLGLKQGDQIEFVIKNGMTLIRPVRGEINLFAVYAGALGGFNTKDDVNIWLADLRDEINDVDDA